MKLHTKVAILALSSLCASAAWANESTSFYGQSWGGDNYHKMDDSWCWSNGSPYGKFTEATAMDVLFSAEVIAKAKADKQGGTDAWWAASVGTYAESAGVSWATQHFNSITIKGKGISWMGIGLGSQIWLAENDYKGTDAYAGMLVHKDFTVDDHSTRIVSGGVKANKYVAGGFTTVHATVEIKGNFVYGYNNTVEDTNSGYNFRFGGDSGYRTAADGAAVDSNVNPLDSVVIGKDMRLGGGHGIQFNVGVNSYDGGYDLSKPDVEIKGRIVGNGGFDSDGNQNDKGFTLWGSKQSNIELISLKNANNADNGRTSVISVNGLSGTLTIYNNVAKYSSKNHLAVLNLTNDASTSVTATHLSDESNVQFSDTSKIKVVMNGEGEQRFRESFNISGGIDVNSGALLIRSTTQGTNGYTWNKANETEAKSHGDLVMNGGIFGFYLADSLNKNFRGGFTLTNLEYNGGKIRLCAYGDYVDSLDVSGTITATDAIVFDFVAQGGDFSYLTSGARKIISWASKPSDATYEANDITVGGTTYKAEFTELADGLYVQYTSSIPEPATCALLFGGLALAFAAWRKKRQ